MRLSALLPFHYILFSYPSFSPFLSFFCEEVEEIPLRAPIGIEDFLLKILGELSKIHSARFGESAAKSKDLLKLHRGIDLKREEHDRWREQKKENNKEMEMVEKIRGREIRGA